ncbi:MAG: hypothetical protein ACK5LO_03175 [Leucobacter sp.]
MTAVLLGIAAVMTLAVLLVVPRGHSIITVWGSRTLYVYLLHGPIVWIGRETGVIDDIGSLGDLGIVVLTVIAIALTVVLSMQWVTRVFKPVIEPSFDWLLKKES